MTRPAPIRVRFVPDHNHIEAALLGTVEIGRVSPTGYLFKLRRPWADWKRTKSLLAAKNGLMTELTDFLRDAGLQQVPE